MELLLVVAILAVLASLMIPLYGYFRRRAQDAVCMTNLRSLHAALSSYLTDHGEVWPQYPNANANDDSSGESAQAKWWYETLKPYGPTRKTWLCPAHTVDSATENDPQNYDFSYLPTNFSSEPNIAYKWKQPWLIEVGGFHDGNQANQVMPQGDIRKGTAPGPQ